MVTGGFLSTNAASTWMNHSSGLVIQKTGSLVWEESLPDPDPDADPLEAFSEGMIRLKCS